MEKSRYIHDSRIVMGIGIRGIPQKRYNRTCLRVSLLLHSGFKSWGVAYFDKQKFIKEILWNFFFSTALSCQYGQKLKFHIRNWAEHTLLYLLCGLNGFQSKWKWLWKYDSLEAKNVETHASAFFWGIALKPLMSLFLTSLTDHPVAVMKSAGGMFSAIYSTQKRVCKTL